VFHQPLLGKGSRHSVFLRFHVHILTDYRLPHSSSWSNSWLLSHRRVYPPLSTNRYHWLALISDSQLVCSSVLKSESEFRHDWPLTANQFVLATSPLSLTSSNVIFQLNICGYSPYVTSFLTRIWVCRLPLLPVFASAVILRSESCRNSWPIILSQIRDSSNLKGQVPVFIFPEQSGSVLSPGTGFPFRHLQRLVGLRWRH
jgi:hypothetical protein